jgi:hypothetical protein
MNEGPADRERLTSDDFLLNDEAENLTFIESCLLLADDLERGDLPCKCVTIFSVELVLEDFRFGGCGGTTGTNDLTLFGNGPNISKGLEMFVMG